MFVLTGSPSCWDGVYASDGNYTGHVCKSSSTSKRVELADSQHTQTTELTAIIVPKVRRSKDESDGQNFQRNSSLCSLKPTGSPEMYRTTVTEKSPTSCRMETLPVMGYMPTLCLAGSVRPCSRGQSDTDGTADTFDKVVTDCRYMNQTVEGTGTFQTWRECALITTDYTDVSNCPILAKSYDDAAGRACLGQTPIVDEVVGAISPINQLPGCNALWVGNVSKPGCPPGTIDGGTVHLVQPTIWLNQSGYVG